MAVFIMGGFMGACNSWATDWGNTKTTDVGLQWSQSMVIMSMSFSHSTLQVHVCIKDSRSLHWTLSPIVFFSCSSSLIDSAAMCYCPNDTPAQWVPSGQRHQAVSCVLCPCEHAFWQFYPEGRLWVLTYCGYEGGIEGILAESKKQTCLADSAVTNKQQFEEIIICFRHCSALFTSSQPRSRRRPSGAGGSPVLKSSAVSGCRLAGSGRPVLERLTSLSLCIMVSVVWLELLFR